MRTKRCGPAGWISALAILVMVGLGVPACTSDPPQSAGTATTPPNGTAAPGTLPTAPMFTSKNGVLHLKVKATKVSSSINGRDYNNLYTYDTSLVDDAGTYTPGTASAYLGPQWNVQPGDEVVIDYINALPDNEFTPIGATTAEDVAQPINLHTHGLTVAPNGNSDNVLLSIPQGRSQRYDFKIPADHLHGLYWYHSHIHGLSDDGVYQGMAGHIVVGRADGDYRELDGLPVVPMLVRYSVVEPGAGGGLVDASPWDTKGTATAPRGGMIYTLNGVQAPRIKLNSADPATGTPAETQVWAFTNVTGSASYVIALDEVDAAQANDIAAIGTPVDFRVVSIDGTPMPAPIVKTGAEAARGYLLGQGGRVAIQVDGASDPSKVIRLIQVENRGGTGEASAYDWPNQKPIGGYRDYTRDILGVSTTDLTVPGRHVATPTTLTPNYPVADAHLETATVEQQRTFVYNAVAPPTAAAPNNFPVDFSLFPGNPVVQPRVGTVEEWTILNYSSLHHPFHLHTQHGKVMRIESPLNPEFRDAAGDLPAVQYVTDLAQPEPAPYYQDIINIPPAEVDAAGMPILAADGTPAKPGVVVLRVSITDYLGTYVQHCHRLPHEDRGMMSMVRSIPHDPVVAVARVAEGSGVIDVVGSIDGRTLATITPFPGHAGPLSTAVGDVDGDAIPDVAVATGPGPATAAKVYSGASIYRDAIRTVTPFDGATFGAEVALGDLNGDRFDDIIVGQRAGAAPRVSIYDGVASAARLADFDAYEATFTGGVSVAAGSVEAGGRISLITGAGPGRPPTVNVYNFDLFGDAEGRPPDVHTALTPLPVGTQAVGPAGYTGGISVATGYPLATTGGFATVLVTTRSGPTTVSLVTIGSHHEGEVDVAASGVARPHDYQPDGHRTVTVLATVDLGTEPGFGAGATAAAVSTPTGAHLVVAPAAGGAVMVWALDPTTFARTPVPTPARTGSGVSAM